MDEYFKLVRRLPEPFARALGSLPEQIARRVQEIRLRAEQPVQFTVNGRLVAATALLPDKGPLACVNRENLQQCFLALCGHSVYAYEEELACGYFTLPGGYRVGVAGVAGVAGFAVVTALNLRVARWVTCPLPAAVEAALDRLDAGLLVAGPPGSGKTTVLRSMVCRLAAGNRIICVVDERGELMADASCPLEDKPAVNCDVYTRYPKAKAIEMALRCMNPQAIVCDELGTAADAEALEAGLASGAVFLASVHCESPESLQYKPQLARLLGTGAFTRAVFLAGRDQPGQIAQMVPLV